MEGGGMKRFLWVMAMLTLVGLLPSFAASRPAPAANPRCVYLPIVKGGGNQTIAAADQPAAQPGADPCAPQQADATPTNTRTATPTRTRTTTPATPTASATATRTPSAVYSLSGTAGLYPRMANIVEGSEPVQLLFVLDVSGSMSANFSGQCNNTGTVVQCAVGSAGSPPVDSTGVGTQYYWNPASERQIAVAKASMARIIDQLNMPGNVDYTATQPSDEVALVWFHHAQTAGMTRGWGSDPAVLKNAVLQAGSYNGDNYRTYGGTNTAAGLYRGSLLLKNRPSSVEYNGQTFNYRRVVLFISDGLGKDFFDPNKPNLNDGESNDSTYPLGSECRNLGNAVLNSAPCQTNEVGGEIAGKWANSRPISQMIKVANDLIKNDPQANAEIIVMAPVDIPATGLKDGVATYPARFYPFKNTNYEIVADGVADVIKGNSGAICVNENQPLVSTISFDNSGSFPPGAWTYPVVGEATLTKQQTGEQVRSNIVAGAGSNGANGYNFANLPAGTYRLSAQLAYRSSVTDTLRLYNTLLVEGVNQQALEIVIGAGDPPSIERNLELVSIENLCAGD
jgi:hypothetical protein